MVLWSAVGSGAPHRFPRISSEKRRRRFALPVHSKLLRVAIERQTGALNQCEAPS